jgi:DNA-binding MurR/RpiR family transcriptional regulator
MIPRMTRSDVAIARKLLAAPDSFAVSSVRAIATEIGVSEPTVVRFCRNVGCDGFKDLKFRLTRDLAFRQAQQDAAMPMMPRALEQRLPDEAASPPRSHLRYIHDRAAEALGAVLQDMELADRAVEEAAMIAGARRVTVYGIGGSSAILADEIHNRLFRLGVGSTAYTDSYAQRMAAAALGSEDIALFISSTGRPRSLQDSLELAKYYGARTIAITDRDSPIGRDADVCLGVSLSQSRVHEFQPNPMRYAQMLVIDLLAFLVAEKLGPHARQMLRQTRASIAMLHGIAPQQPIGD